MLLKILSKLANASWQMDNERCLIVYSFCSVGGWMLRLNALSLLWWQSNHASKLQLDEISHRDTFIWDNTDTSTQYLPQRLLKTNNKSFCYLLFHCSHIPLQLFHPLLTPVILTGHTCLLRLHKSVSKWSSVPPKPYPKIIHFTLIKKSVHSRRKKILAPNDRGMNISASGTYDSSSKPTFQVQFRFKRKCNPLFWNRRIVSELVHMLIFMEYLLYMVYDLVRHC